MIGTAIAASVEREDRGGPQRFCRCDQGCISQVHGVIRVLPHQLERSRQRAGVPARAFA
ncbi:MAG: hypothetical protein L6Q84_33855 [Polyangiaceae bacterium]|nr:hypothetical protein [Polyangiaceae bacterium]